MSCFFCDSLFHCSEYCGVYSSDESRRKVLSEKKFCEYCISPVSDEGCLHALFFKRKCYICFENEHSTIFCPSRKTAQPLFIPKIDNDLLSRFLKLFNFVERHSSLVFSSPRAFNSAGIIKPLKVFQVMNAQGISSIDDCEIFVIGSIYFESSFPDSTYKLARFFQAVASNTVMAKISDLSMRRLYMIAPCDVLQLLTPKIQVFDITCTVFDSEITFRDIIQRIPNATSIKLSFSNVTMGNSWPEEMLQYKNGANLEFFSISIHQSFNFDCETFVEMIKTRCTKNCEITITGGFTDLQFNAVQNKLLPFFNNQIPYTKNTLLCLHNCKFSANKQPSLSFVLKESK